MYVTESVLGEGGKKTKMLGRAMKKGFETTFVVELGKDECLVVAAVQDGEEIRRSNMVSCKRRGS